MSSSFTITRPRLWKPPGNEEILSQVLGRGHEAGAQIVLIAVRRDRQAVHRADVDTGVALDAELGGEVGLHVAIETALDLTSGLLRVEPQLHFHAQFLEALYELDVLHLLPSGRIVVVGVGPLVHPHLRGDQVLVVGQPFCKGDVLAVVVDGDGRLMCRARRPR